MGGWGWNGETVFAVGRDGRMSFTRPLLRIGRIPKGGVFFRNKGATAGTENCGSGTPIGSLVVLLGVCAWGKGVGGVQCCLY